MIVLLRPYLGVFFECSRFARVKNGNGDRFLGFWWVWVASLIVFCLTFGVFAYWNVGKEHILGAKDE